MSVLGFFTVSSVRNSQLEHLQSYLTNEARLVADAAAPGLIMTDGSQSIDTLAKKIGADIDARITIIAADGTVLGDSWENPAAMENHLSRPEVNQALVSGKGTATRPSTTEGEPMMYSAVAITGQGKVLGVARVALALTTVNDQVNSTIRNTALAISLVALLVILAAAFITRIITHQTRQVTRAAMRIASGKLDQQIEVQSRDELGQLGRAFNKMSVNLNEMMAATADERSKLLAVLSAMTDGVIMTDGKGKVLLTNPAAESLFNFKESKAIGKPLIEVIINHKVEETLKNCLALQQKQTDQIDTANSRFLRMIAVPFKTDKIAGALLLFQDLTELRNLQTMRREFVGNVSHELRTPLAAIKALVETLQDGAIHDEKVAQDFLNKVSTEVDSLTQMVNELIELSRIETGSTKLNLEAVLLNEIVQSVIRHLTPQAERKQIAIIPELAVDIPSIQADRERIQQVITNILHNAVKFTPVGGKIKVTTKNNPDEVTVNIADTGIGISKEDLPHIFERFFKADKSRTTEGSGLGLAIAKHIIQAHGGRIRVESQEGKGSTFEFSLPMMKK